MRLVQLTLFLSLAITSFGQHLTFSEPIPIEIDGKTTSLLDVAFDGKNIVIVGHIKNDKNLNALILKISLTGTIIERKIIGTPNSYDRATNILYNEQGYWILINKLEDKTRGIELIHFSKELEQIEKYQFEKKGFIVGKGLTQISSNEIGVLIDYEKKRGIWYPIVVKLETNSKEQLVIHFDKNNQSIYPRKDNFMYGVTGEGTFPDTVKHYIKNATNLNVINGNLYVMGTEDTGNNGDQWAASSTSEGTIVWDRLFEKENDPGVDYFCNAQASISSNGGIALFGVNYNKLENLDYDYNYILTDKKGNIKTQKNYERGFDEHLVEGFKFGNNYLLTGYVSEEPDKAGWVGDNVVDKNLWYILINEKGTIASDEYLKKEEMQSLIASTPISNNELVSIYKQRFLMREKFFILLTKIQ